MKLPAEPAQTNHPTLPALPGRGFRARGEDLETLAFSSGVALASLDMVLTDPQAGLPGALLRSRLALLAAAACLKLEGRRDSPADIRDAFYLTHPGDAMGPAGEMLARWRGMSALRLTHKGWQAQLQSTVPEALAVELPTWMDAAMGQGSPVAQAARMAGLVQQAFPRQEAAALICGDVVLARAFGWAHPVALLGLHLKREVSLQACHKAAVKGAQNVVRLAHDLTRRAQRLRAVAPKLRAKGAGAAVALFLVEDAVLPSAMLSPQIKGSRMAMTDRAARRLCDRLVDLGVVREVTGRATFRLYGV